jgi:Tfp pilus assembly protein PilN
MKHLFVSPERILLQRYKHDRPFRVAGTVLMMTAALQAPLAVCGVLLWARFQEQGTFQSQIRARSSDLQAQNASVRDLRQKIGQIRQWEAVLQNRIPSSAMLSALQKSIPADVVLDSIEIEAADFRAVSVTGGFYRVPDNYVVTLQALAKPGTTEAIERFKASLSKILPPGSEISKIAQVDQRSDGLIPVQIRCLVKPTGNYLSLGLNRISEPDAL